MLFIQYNLNFSVIECLMEPHVSMPRLIIRVNIEFDITPEVEINVSSLEVAFAATVIKHRLEESVLDISLLEGSKYSK